MTEGTKTPTLGQSNLAVKPVRGGALLRKIVNAVVGRFQTKDGCYDIENINPLYGLTAGDAQSIFDFARSGNYARLQFIYNEIERTDPTLLVCVTRRKSALSELDWKVVRSDQRLHNPGITPEMEQKQIEFLETFIARIENLPEAIEHLALAAFRGYSHIVPLWTDGDKTQVRKFQLPNSWNFCYDKKAHCWLWNPEASSFENPSRNSQNLKEIPKDELVTVVDGLAIDWPALMIFLRKSMGEKQWGRFLEQFGIPPVILTMPELEDEKAENEYVEAAQAVFDGRNGVVPYGTGVNWATEARGSDPYTAFLDYQSKQIVLMATGGYLTSLTEAGSGTLAGNAHEDTWKQIAKRYVRIVSNAINKQLCEPVMRRVFPGQPILAEFKLETEADLTASEVLDLAGKARAAGYTMDETELSEQTGYTIKRDPAQDPMGGGMPPNGPGMPPTSTPGGPSLAPTAGNDAGNAPVTPRVAPEGSGTDGNPVLQAKAPEAVVAVLNAGEGQEPTPRSAKEKLAAALQADFKPIADELVKIMAMPEDEQAQAATDLATRLPDLLPEDPQMAAVIAQEMMQAFEAKAAADGTTVTNAETDNWEPMDEEEARRICDEMEDE